MKKYFFINRKGRKAKDKESLCDDNKLYLEEAVLEKKIPDIDLKILIEIPNGIDYNEWLASHSKYISCLWLLYDLYNIFIFYVISAISIFDNTNLIYGTVSEFCTTSGCPDMIGPSYRYLINYELKVLLNVTVSYTVEPR